MVAHKKLTDCCDWVKVTLCDTQANKVDNTPDFAQG
jgi:hypothetical protein